MGVVRKAPLANIYITLSERLGTPYYKTNYCNMELWQLENQEVILLANKNVKGE